MSRPFSLTKAPKAKNGSGPPPGGEAELLGGPLPLLPERYESRPARPFTAIAIRVALWGAVAIGCLGGIVGLVRPPAEAPAPTAEAGPEPGSMPGSVAGTAELVVRKWLTASPDTEDEVLSLFVEPPTLEGLSAGDLSVGRVTTIAGKVLQENYWAVTVEAEVTETVPVVDPTDPAAAEDAGGEEPTERRTSIWYLEVPIVGDPRTGLLALTRPSVLPGPPSPVTGWRASVNRPVTPGEDDPTLRAVEGFLDALLAGSGDPGRYVAPGVVVTAANPPVFADTEVVDVAIDQIREGEYRVLAQIKATTPGGARQMYSYELVVVERVDRLEITQFAGAPTLVAGSAQPPAAEGGDDEGDGEGDPGGGGGRSGEGDAGDGGSQSGQPDPSSEGGQATEEEAPASSADTTTPATATDPAADEELPGG